MFLRGFVHFVCVSLLLFEAAATNARIPDVVYESSGYTPDEINALIGDDCPYFDTPLSGLIRGPPRATPDDLLLRNSFVKRSGSTLTLAGKPFPIIGPNIYWLGVDENVDPPNPTYPSFVRILEALATVKAMGGTTIRGHTLGISLGFPIALEPELDVFNEEAFKTIDFAIMAARLYGLKLIIPLTDNYNWYHGGKYQFLGWHNISFSGTGADISPEGVGAYFYNTTEIVDSFKRYTHNLLTHVNEYTGIAFKDDPTIAAWESGNELSAARFGDGPAPPEWTRDIARFVKRLSPKILFSDGTYGIHPESGQLEVEEVDIFSDHFYPPNIAKLTKGLDSVKKVNKVYYVGEFDWTGKNGGDDLATFLEALPGLGVSGFFFWSLFGKDDNCCQYVEHDDGFSFYHLRDEHTLQRGLVMSTAAWKWRGFKSGKFFMIRQFILYLMGFAVVPELPIGVACPQRFTIPSRT